jgi:site-specific DNA-methyltransferase (adenine-specific)
VPKNKNGGRPRAVGRPQVVAVRKDRHPARPHGGSPHGGRLQRPKSLYRTKPAEVPPPGVAAQPISSGHFELHEDGTIQVTPSSGESALSPRDDSSGNPQGSQGPVLTFRDDTHGLWLYHGNCLELLDAIYAKYGDNGRFDMIFADPPYFLSNGGITCHAGKMVKVDKGDWDQSRGAELNHEFNTEWLARCQRVLKPNGTIWVSGTHHVIFSIGFAMQQLGYKILNDIAWEKPNPPPNLSCRYFTHSTETILWAAKSRESRHTFNYSVIRQIAGGKQMKTVWRNEKSTLSPREQAGRETERGELNSIWTLPAPGNGEKAHGKHPTQKPVELVKRCLLASTNPGDLVLDPFLGGGTTAIAALKLKRQCVGIELDEAHAKLASQRIKAEIRQLEEELFR